MRTISLVLFSLIISACGSGGGSGSTAAVAPKDPGVVAPPAAPACADSALLNRVWRAFVVSGHAADVNATFRDDCTVQFHGAQCPSTWRVVGRTDQTWTATQSVTLELVSNDGPYDAWCPRPEMSPYTCTSNKFYDAGLGRDVVALNCDKGLSGSWLGY